jgi:hypothetical protein
MAIDAGAAGGSWLGHGITSSVGAADPTHLGIGVFDNAMLNSSTFGGLTVDAASILVSLAHLGDANDNGIVDIQDQSLITNNWQQPSKTWAGGDLNRDGVVDIQDLTIVTNNWQQAATLSLDAVDSAPVISVPEPSSLSLLSFAGTLLLRRRRCRNNYHSHNVDLSGVS